MYSVPGGPFTLQLTALTRELQKWSSCLIPNCAPVPSTEATPSKPPANVFS